MIICRKSMKAGWENDRLEWFTKGSRYVVDYHHDGSVDVYNNRNRRVQFDDKRKDKYTIKYFKEHFILL